MKKILFTILACFVILVLIPVSCIDVDDTTTETTTDTITTELVAETHSWVCDTSVDKMTDKRVILYGLNSDNEVSAGDVYGTTDAYICIRDNNGKRDVMFSIANGQIIGNSFNGDNYIDVRFDDNAVERYWFDECNDMSSTTIFLKSANKFISKAKTANKILIKVSLYEAGNPTFEFNTDTPLTI